MTTARTLKLRRRCLLGLAMTLATSCSGPGPLNRVEMPHSTIPVVNPAPATNLPPPPDIADLVATTTMTEAAQRIFRSTDPVIEDKASFDASCEVGQTGSIDARTHSRGCFAAGRIHLRAPDRAETRELVYVIAAHELLHAVYASLGPQERRRIDAELAAARVGNDRLEERLAPYGATHTLTNEMHSILGSEFEALSPALEAHYAQYFSNRGVIVAARQRTLGDRENEIRKLRGLLAELDARIKALGDVQEQRRKAVDLRRYNDDVEEFNELILRYNTAVEALNARISEYNDLLSG